MKIKKFTPENMPSYQRKGQASISFNRKGTISVSVAASAALGLKEGDRVCLIQDEDSPKDWFFTKDKGGFTVRKMTNAISYSFCANQLVKHFMSENQLSEKVRLVVFGLSIVQNEEAGGYLIQTRVPLKVSE